MNVIKPLNLPKATLKLAKKDQSVFVWCVIRKKNLVLTPEEWVRQHVIHYLISFVGIAPERIASEMAITVNGLTRRCDIVVVDRTGKPKLIVECKATAIPVNEKVLFQIAQYNRELQVDYLMLTNGNDHFLAKINQETGVLEQLNGLEKEWLY